MNDCLKKTFNYCFGENIFSLCYFNKFQEILEYLKKNNIEKEENKNFLSDYDIDLDNTELFSSINSNLNEEDETYLNQEYCENNSEIQNFSLNYNFTNLYQYKYLHYPFCFSVSPIKNFPEQNTLYSPLLEN